MAEVQCSRCGSTAEGLERAPLPGEVGRMVFEQTCGECWKAWLAAQVILMNEHRLSPGDPAHYERLVTEMQTFLALRGE